MRRLGVWIDPNKTKYFCTPIKHPFGTEPDVVDVMSSSLNCIEVFVQACFYKGQPIMLLPDAGHAESCLNMRRIFSVIAYLITMASSVKHISAPSDGEDGGNRDAKITVDSGVRASVTWEIVRKDNTRTGPIVGYRMRVYEQAASPGCLRYTSFSQELRELLRHNDGVALKSIKTLQTAVQSRAKPTAASSYHHVTSNEWRHLCEWYAARDFTHGARRAMNGDVFSPECPYNVNNVFTLDRSASMARDCGALPAYWDRDQVSSYQYADPTQVWRIAETSIDPATLEYVKIPSLCADPRMHEEARAQYIRLHSDNPDAGAFFDRTSVRVSTDADTIDIHYLTAHVAKVRKEAEAQHGVGTAAFKEAWRAKQGELNDLMVEIISPQGNASPSVQKIAAFGDSWLQKNGGTFFMQRDQTFANLTRANDLWAIFAALLETIVTVKSAHKSVTAGWIASLCHWFRTALNAHQMHLGPQSTGKSFGAKFIGEMLIEGTVLSVIDVTNRAMLYSEKQLDGLLILLDDAPASLFGVQSAGAKGKAGAVSSDKENMMKAILTAVRAVLPTVEKEPHLHTSVKTSDCCSTVIVCMNDPSDAFPGPILDRFDVWKWLDIKRGDGESIEAECEGPSMIARTERASDEAVRAATSTMKTFMQFVQMMACNVGWRIAAGILAQPNMEALTILFELIRTRMVKRYGITMEKPRTFKRMRLKIAQVVVLRAIGELWMSTTSPLADGRAHKNEHFLWIEKHLVARVEDVVFVMGLSTHLWQNDLGVTIQQAMKTRFYRNIDATIEEHRVGVVDATLMADVADADISQGASSAAAAAAAPAQMQLQRASGRQQMQLAVGGGGGGKRPEHDGFAEWHRSNAQRFNGGGRGGGGRPTTDEERREMEKAEKQARELDERVNWQWATVYRGPLFTPPRQRNPTQMEMAHNVAMQIYPHLVDRPLLSEVTAAIHAMTQETDVVERNIVEYAGGPVVHTERADNVSALVLEPEFMRMSLARLDARNLQTDLLFNATKDVLEHLLHECQREEGAPAPRLEYLFGDTEHHDPYVWRMMRLEPKRHDGITTRLYSANFFDDALQRSTVNFLRTIEPKTAGAEATNALFSSKTPWRDIDFDIDAFAVEQHTASLCLTFDEQDAMPSNRAEVMDPLHRAHFEAVAEARGETVALVYPECFERRRSKARKFAAVWRTRQRANRAAFSMAGIMRASRERRAAMRNAVVALAVEPPPLERNPVHFSVTADTGSAAMDIDDDADNEGYDAAAAEAERQQEADEAEAAREQAAYDAARMRL